MFGNRLDLLPLLVDLAHRADVSRIVLQLDPTLEPGHLCWAIGNLVLAGCALWMLTGVLVMRNMIRFDY